jgi:CheY-like chemotaxis protein
VTTKKQILIVDDDRDVREILAAILSDEGYDVGLATDGLDALEQLRRGVCPNAILLDLMMPVMDGWKFLTEVRRAPALAHIPVIVMTASGRHHEVARRLHHDRCIAKPMAIEVLLHELEEVCAHGDDELRSGPYGAARRASSLQSRTDLEVL